jgi:hypothetical protein
MLWCPLFRPVLLRQISAGLVISAALLLPVPLRADEVHLKGGASFSGRIVEQTDAMVTMDIGDGVVGIPASRIEKIVKGHSPLDEYDARAKALKPDNIDGWRTLGRWAAQQGLQSQARKAYQNVMTMAPNDPEARQALGYVQVNGQWMTEEESYRARGYVKVGNEWMTPSEAQQMQSSAAAAQAQQDAERRANQAEADRILAEQRADKAEERARAAEEVDPWSQMGYQPYLGGWGYGMTTWPGGVNAQWRPANKPPGASSTPRPPH